MIGRADEAARASRMCVSLGKMYGSIASKICGRKLSVRTFDQRIGFFTLPATQTKGIFVSPIVVSPMNDARCSSSFWRRMPPWKPPLSGVLEKPTSDNGESSSARVQIVFALCPTA